MSQYFLCFFSIFAILRWLFWPHDAGDQQRPEGVGILRRRVDTVDANEQKQYRNQPAGNSPELNETNQKLS